MQIFRCNKLVKATIKSHSLRWLKCVDENTDSQPKEFWKYMAFVRKTNSSYIQLAVGGNDLVEPSEVANILKK